MFEMIHVFLWGALHDSALLEFGADIGIVCRKVPFEQLRQLHSKHPLGMYACQSVCMLNVACEVLSHSVMVPSYHPAPVCLSTR